MNSPTCAKCDCVKGCQSNPSPCPILLAECIASGQVSAYQIEQHRVLDAVIEQPEQPVKDFAEWLATQLGDAEPDKYTLASRAYKAGRAAQPKDKP